jgi:hypothetical protein
MPRASSSDPLNTTPVKRAPRRRVSSDSVSTTSPKTATTPRSRRPRATVASSEPVVARKAPPRNPLPTTTKKKVSKGNVAVVIIFILILGGSVWIGTTDAGPIDVNAKLVEMSQRASNGGDGNNQGGSTNTVIPVQNAPTVPNGGFRGRGVGTPPVQAPQPTPEETASSTATSTEEAVEEVNSEGEEAPSGEATPT